MPRLPLTLAVVLIAPAAALAQPAAMSDKAPAQTQAVNAQGSAVATADPTPDPRFAQAEPHLERGEGLFEAGNYGAALAEFERAYEILEGHPKRFETLYNIALCHQHLFRYDRAMQYLRRYLAEGGSGAPDRAEVEAAIASLEGLLGSLRIAVNTKAEVWVDDRLAGEAPGEVLVPGGSHSVELRAAGFEPGKQEINVPAREARELRFLLRPIPRSAGFAPTYFWVAGGAALVAAGAGLQFGLQASSKSDALRRRERDELDRLTLLERDGDDVADLALAADLFFGAAGLLAAGTVVLYFLTDWEGEPVPAPQAGAGIGVSASADGGMVHLRGAL